MSHGPVEEEIRQFMQALGHTVEDIMPAGWGFTLLMFQTDANEGRMNYLSNARREDMLAALKEFIAHAEGRGHDAPGMKQ